MFFPSWRTKDWKLHRFSKSDSAEKREKEKQEGAAIKENKSNKWLFLKPSTNRRWADAVLMSSFKVPQSNWSRAQKAVVRIPDHAEEDPDDVTRSTKKRILSDILSFSNSLQSCTDILISSLYLNASIESLVDVFVVLEAKAKADSKPIDCTGAFELLLQAAKKLRSAVREDNSLHDRIPDATKQLLQQLNSLIKTDGDYKSIDNAILYYHEMAKLAYFFAIVPDVRPASLNEVADTILRYFKEIGLSSRSFTVRITELNAEVQKIIVTQWPIDYEMVVKAPKSLEFQGTISGYGAYALKLRAEMQTKYQSKLRDFFMMAKMPAKVFLSAVSAAGALYAVAAATLPLLATAPLLAGTAALLAVPSLAAEAGSRAVKIAAAPIVNAFSGAKLVTKDSASAELAPLKKSAAIQQWHELIDSNPDQSALLEGVKMLNMFNIAALTPVEILLEAVRNGVRKQTFDNAYLSLRLVYGLNHEEDTPRDRKLRVLYLKQLKDMYMYTKKLIDAEYFTAVWGFRGCRSCNDYRRAIQQQLTNHTFPQGKEFVYPYSVDETYEHYTTIISPTSKTKRRVLASEADRQERVKIMARIAREKEVSGTLRQKLEKFVETKFDLQASLIVAKYFLQQQEEVQAQIQKGINQPRVRLSEEIERFYKDKIPMAVHQKLDLYNTPNRMPLLQKFIYTTRDDIETFDTEINKEKSGLLPSDLALFETHVRTHAPEKLMQALKIFSETEVPPPTRQQQPLLSTQKGWFSNLFVNE